MIGHRPARDPADERVVDDGQEHEPGPARQVSDVCEPELVESSSVESTLDEGRCCTSRVVLARGPRPFVLRYPREPHLSHQSTKSLANNMGTILGDLSAYARRPIGTTAVLMNVADARLEDIMGYPAPRWLRVSPHVEPARGVAAHTGLRRDAVAGLIHSHEFERFPGPSPSPERTRLRPLPVFRVPHAAGGSHDEDGDATRAMNSSTQRFPDHRQHRFGGPSCGWSRLSTQPRERPLESRAPREPALRLGGQTQPSTVDVFVASRVSPPEGVRYPRRRVNSTLFRFPRVKVGSQRNSQTRNLCHSSQSIQRKRKFAPSITISSDSTVSLSYRAHSSDGSSPNQLCTLEALPAFLCSMGRSECSS